MGRGDPVVILAFEQLGFVLPVPRTVWIQTRVS